MPRTPVPVALTLLLLPLAACESDPPAASATTSSASSAPTTSAPTRTAAMTTKEAATFWKAAPKHLKSAYAAAYGKKYDRSALADVFAEPSLSVFTFASRYKQAVKAPTSRARSASPPRCCMPARRVPGPSRR